MLDLIVASTYGLLRRVRVCPPVQAPRPPGGLPSPVPAPTTDTPPPHNHHDSNNIFAMGHGSFHAGDFNDELASLINPQSNERSTQSPDNNHSSNNQGGDGGYRPPPHTHNIFDISAPHSHHHHQQHPSSVSSTSSSFPSHFSLPSASSNNGNGNGSSTGSPGSIGATDTGNAPQPGPQYHFNSTLPALNSSMRYDPHPPGGQGGYHGMPSPSSFRRAGRRARGWVSARFFFFWTWAWSRPIALVACHLVLLLRSPTPFPRVSPTLPSLPSPSCTSLLFFTLPIFFALFSFLFLFSFSFLSLNLPRPKLLQPHPPPPTPTTTPPPARPHAHDTYKAQWVAEQHLPPPRPVPQAIVIPGGGNNGANRGSPYAQGWFGVNGDYPHATPDSLPSLTSLPSLPSLGSLNSIASLNSPHAHHGAMGAMGSTRRMDMGGTWGARIRCIVRILDIMDTTAEAGDTWGARIWGDVRAWWVSSSPPFFPPPPPSLLFRSTTIMNANGSYGSPVEAKFGGMGLNSIGGMGNGMGGVGVGMGGLGLGVGEGEGWVGWGWGLVSVLCTLGLPGSLGSNGLNGSSSLNGSLNGGSGGNGNGNGNAGGGAGESKAESKASLLAHEKRRRRRESHNAVERRRRDNINEKISELATLIPECLLEGGAQGQGQSPGSPDDALLSPTSGGNGAGDWPLVLPGTKKETDDDGKDGKEGAVVKANKGMILRKSVEYIRYLQQLVAAQGARNRELEEQLKGFRGSSGSASPPSIGGLGLSATSNSTGDGMDNDFGHMGGMGGGWSGMLAPMPEGEDEELHELANGNGNEGMEVDGEEKRGRRAKRSSTNGVEKAAVEKGAAKTKSPTKGAAGRKVKKVQEVDEDEDDSDLSEDGMEV
ncbi:helix-loop-helix DNA-binding domain-containing protein [Mycena leptocephala]|nr:helix-loop-helix DNA-binding domain-containing protein [Mycena leptocephala]